MGAKENFLTRWDRAAEIMEIPREAHVPSVRIIKDKSNYSFGVIVNEHRLKKPQEKTSDCPLCDIVATAEKDSALNLLPENKASNFIFVPNKFPFYRGSSLAISRGKKENERGIYSTKNLDGVSEEISLMLDIGKNIGLRAVHNTPGAGASIPNHEHWHFIDFDFLYQKTGEKFGFEAARYDSLKNVLVMPDFPFAHLIFNPTKTEDITRFLFNIGKSVGCQFPNGSVPHFISQGNEGVLVAPAKNYLSKGPGAADIAGHILCRSVEEFAKADNSYCLNRLSEALFSREEIELKKFL